MLYGSSGQNMQKTTFCRACSCVPTWR